MHGIKLFFYSLENVDELEDEGVSSMSSTGTKLSKVVFVWFLLKVFPILCDQLKQSSALFSTIKKSSCTLSKTQ